MDPQDAHQPGPARRVARVKARARSWRAITALILAVAAAAVSHEAGLEFHGFLQPGPVMPKVVTAAAAVAFCLLAAVAVIELASKARDVLQPLTGSGHAAVVRYAAVLAGMITALIITLDLLKLPIGQLVVGAGLAAVLVGIAAQQSLSNVFAGIVLLLSRPFAAGDHIHLRSGALNGPIEGTVAEIGITYLRLDTGTALLHVPNSQVLASAVARIPQPAAPGPDQAGVPAPGKATATGPAGAADSPAPAP